MLTIIINSLPVIVVFQPTKKNVRFADLCYDEEPEQSTGGGNEKLFTKRNSGEFNFI